ncbi:nucleoside phosphorylase domain-containing protein [Xylariales sp. PMI_506]|nr:nucleoside phosphorylase domain-containing protein [Xylariales sp. PMI_506]
MSDPNKFTIGWICAISSEYAAARAFLDEEYESPEKFVIAVLPEGEYGIASAATVATNILHTFQNIRIGLMVGIAGGAPNKKYDIRLGDVVVGVPRNGKGGVLQCEFGKTVQGKDFEETGFLNQPPTVLRTAVNDLKARYEADGHTLKQYIAATLDKKPRLKKKYSKPDSESDKLYRSDRSNLVFRAGRDDDENDPEIHYGLIASANQLMKDAYIRDTLAEKQDVLCFEMKSAGLMNHFPCLVIRGICDYSDSHKNKQWQGYAAMVVAAYTKDLLNRIARNKLEAEKNINELLSAG